MKKLNKIIDKENLNKEETYKFINNAFHDGFVQSTGTTITKVLPPMSRLTQTSDRTKKCKTVLEKFGLFFTKF